MSTAASDKPKHRPFPRKHWFGSIKAKENIIEGNSRGVKKTFCKLLNGK